MAPTATTTTKRGTTSAKAKTTAARSIAPAKAKPAGDLDCKAVVRDMRRELVAGTSQAPVLYALTLAEFATNARRTFGTFRQLSTNNRLLLESQGRKLGESWKWLFAGSKQWADLGRDVRTDAVAKTIQIPRTRKTTDPATGTKEETFLGFMPFKGYFDYTDTVAKNPDHVEPNWDEPLAAGDRATLDALVEAAAGEGLTVRFADWSARNENGTLFTDGTLVVDDSLPLGNQIKVLAHQLAAHHLDHPAKLAAASHRTRDDVRQQCAAEAVLAELLVMKMLGLDEQVGNDVTASAAAYLSSWITEDGTTIDGHRKRIALLDEKINVSLAAASKVIDRYLTVTGQTPAHPIGG